MFEIAYTIKDEELEKTYNHVHHAQTLIYLENGRLEYLKAIGFPNESLISVDIFLVLTRVDVRFKRELFAGPIRITCENPMCDGKFMRLDQKIFNERGKVAVEALMEFACLSRKSGRAIEPPEPFLSKFLGELGA